MISKKPENTVPNIWTAQESLIQFYKIIAVGMGCLFAVTLIFTIFSYFREPIVVVKNGHNQEFLPANRQDVKVEKTDVEEFIKYFLSSLYKWKEFNSKQIADQIRPLAEESLVLKITSAQDQKFEKLVDKKLSQDLAFVNVQVLPEKVTANFLRIIKIEGIPLVIPTELTFSLIEGSRTNANPIGIYVSGIREVESAK